MTKLENRCSNCGGKFGLVYHNHWNLRFCRRSCRDNFLAKTAKSHALMRKWFGRGASLNERSRPICPHPIQAEAEVHSGCHDTQPSVSGRKLISRSSAATAKLLRAVGERGLHSADKLDYLIRRWIIPDHPCGIRHIDIMPRKIAARAHTSGQLPAD